jgi:ADP-heptose:LPS heptosyltransferase
MQTKSIQSFFSKILDYNQSIAEYEVEKILVLYDEKVLFIGDSCLKFDQLRPLKSFFKHASVDINWKNTGYTTVYTSLLGNNPYITNLTNLDWQEIDFAAYDIIVCITPEEKQLLQLLQNKYRFLIENDLWRTGIFSLSDNMLHPAGTANNPIFPVYQKFVEFAAGHKHQQHIYIAKEEKQWANKWLRENGLQENEQLAIVVDSTSNHERLLTRETYAEVLNYLLSRENVKLLIFDEKNAGKERYYEELLGKEIVPRIIFAKQLDLRKAFCLISSDYVKLVMGPDSGMLHCVAGIYKVLVDNGLPVNQIPLLLAYIGKYREEKPGFWWGSANVLNCLILRKTTTGKETLLLSDMSEEEKWDNSRLLTSDEFTSDMIIDFLKSRSY